MGLPLRVLIVEDSEDDALLVVRELLRAGYEPTHERVESAAALQAALDRQGWDVVISDNTLPHFSGVAALAAVRAHEAELPFIFVSGTIGEEAAVEAMRVGANDYVMKGNLRRLPPAIERELRDAEVRRARHRAEATYRALVEDAPYGIFRSTPDGRLTAVNAALVRMLGYSDDAELLGRNLASDIYVDPAERSGLLREIEHAGGHLTAEARWLRKDGRQIAVRQTSRVARDAQGGTCFDTIVEDITERRQLEAQLRQTQKMEAIGRLAAGVAHDFNNLLTAILGSADLMLETLPADAREREEAQEVRDAARRAAELTRQLLSFSRQPALAPQVIDVNDVVGGLQRLLQRLVGEAVQVRTSLAPDVGPVRADPSQLEQVIVNLAVNARDAMPNGGTFTLKTANVELDASHGPRHEGPATSGSHILLAATDTGCGMDAETQARLFEPFFTTKPVGKGTGLGLATVYGIVKQAGGVIAVESELGRGATFNIYLPRAGDAETQGRHLPSGAAAPRGSETVLLVEDQPEVRKLTRKVLEGRGYTVLVAASGPDALALAERHPAPIALLLADVFMPGMNGPEVALLLLPARPDMKVLYLSGHSSESLTRQGLLEPGAAFLQKPFSPDLLARRVSEALGHGDNADHEAA